MADFSERSAFKFHAHFRFENFRIPPTDGKKPGQLAASSQGAAWLQL